MASETKIAWTDATFNPWIGCAKVAAGCKHCYAEADMDDRRGRVKWGPHGTRSKTSADYWKQPLKWDRQAAELGEPFRVFCASLADVFEDWGGPIVDAKGATFFTDDGENLLRMADLRHDLFELIDATPHLIWQLVTKRPGNIRGMWPDYVPLEDGDSSAVPLGPGHFGKRRDNVHLLTSVSDQETADAMIPELLKCRDLVPVLGLSIEPLLGPIECANVSSRADAVQQWGKRALAGIDWAIIGGESGPNARPCQLEWIESLVRQCRAADVSCFVKQMGANHWNEAPDLGFGRVFLEHPKGGDPSEWPESLRVQEFPNPEGALK